MNRIGIVGGGQLARMLALAGYPLGFEFKVFDPAPDACASQVASLIQSEYDDEVLLARLAEWAEIVTFDFENVPASAAQFLEKKLKVRPSSGVLWAAQDRLYEKGLFWEMEIPIPFFATVDTLEELQEAVVKVELPAVLKTRRLGYDGKGQRVLRMMEDIEPAWQALGGVPLVLEGFVPFEREVSVLAARSRDGAIVYYPLVENHHRSGMLRLSRVPCQAPELEREAWNYARQMLERLNYIGLLAIEFFVHEGRLIANEMAPRVHNSGHWTIEGAETSQFENHLRAIAGLPLGATTTAGPCAMINCIGSMPERTAVLAVPGAHYHDYGKAPRAERKVGHITLRAADTAALEQGLAQLLPLVGYSPDEFG